MKVLPADWTVIAGLAAPMAATMGAVLGEAGAGTTLTSPARISFASAALGFPSLSVSAHAVQVPAVCCTRQLILVFLRMASNRVNFIMPENCDAASLRT